MKKEELNLDYQKAYEVFKETMREGDYILAVKFALEKQIKKKPINREGTTYFYCPVCEGNRLNNYCCDCGQALDWSDDK